MTARLDFDRLLGSVLETDGPTDVPAAVVDAALVRARTVRQRRPVVQSLDRQAWPASRWTPAIPTARALSLAVVALLLMALLAALVSGSFIFRPTRPDILHAIDGVLEPIGRLGGDADAPTLAVALDDGRVLVVGGADQARPADLVDTRTGRVAATGNDAPAGATAAVRLLDGRVLVVGWTYGEPASTGRPDVRIFDPASGAFTTVGPLTTSRFIPSVLPLRDGRVLVFGGVANPEAGPVPSAELFDPSTNRFSPSGWPGPWLDGQTAVQLDDGRILLAGGCTPTPSGLEQGNPTCIADSTLTTIDPTTGRRVSAASMTRARTSPAAVRLSDGRVLLYRTGERGDPQLFGRHGIDPVATDIFDPRTDTVSAGFPLPHAVSVAAPLSDGRVFMAGHWSLARQLASIPPGTAIAGQPPGDYIQDWWLGLYDPRTGESATCPDPIGGGTTLLADTQVAYTSAAVLANDHVVLVNGAEVDVFH